MAELRPVKISSEEDRKRVAIALTNLLRVAADLNIAELNDSDNPFGDIGPSDELMNLRHQLPGITHAQVDALEQGLMDTASSIRKFTSLVRVVAGIASLTRGRFSSGI